MFLSPSTPAGWLMLGARVRMERLRPNDERGASTLEFVIITAVLVALAGAVGWIIYEFVMGQANSLSEPDLPGD